jgi:protein-tyrosine phosphatase
VPFAGLLNFRDLGGYPSDLGGVTRWGEVFRSDSPHSLTAEDLVVFDGLRIETIYDLRRLDERTESPGPRASVHHTLPSRRVADADLETLRDRADGERWLLEDYRGMLDHGAPVFGRLFTKLAAATGPSVIHCYGGKDRTGMASALLLGALGVQRDTVLDDYELTSSFHTEETIDAIVVLFADSNIPRDAALGMLSTPRWVMRTVLDELDRNHGGVQGYLRGPAAMSADALATLQARLLD